MADAIISVVAERLVAIVEEQIKNNVNLVRGVKKEVCSLSIELNTVRDVLDDAEKKGYKDKSVRNWLKKLEDASYEMDNVLDEWNFAILKLKMEQSNADVSPEPKVCSFPSSCLCLKKVASRHDIALKIKVVKEKLDLILAEKDRYHLLPSIPSTDSSRESWRVQSSSWIVLDEVYGRDFDTKTLVDKILHEGSRRQESCLRILSVVGLGGVGKTTLAQLVYYDKQVQEYFKLKFWLCVSDPFDEFGIVKEIIGGNSPNSNQLSTLLESLREKILGKRFLLVLDDVWTEDSTKWEPVKDSLRCGGAGSIVLVTTRNEKVAMAMGTIENDIHHLGQLPDEDCWLLLRRMVLSGRNENEFGKFEDIGRKIANKCKGLPLAANALGSLLRNKKTLEEWVNVLESEIWELEEEENVNKVDLFPHLLLSYNELCPALKRCFSYCVVFPKDYIIIVEKLIRKWMAQGYLGSDGSGGDLEHRGREYFNNLAMRSLFQDLNVDSDGQVRWCKMHDVVHDFVQFLRKNGRVQSGVRETNCQTCSPELVYRIKEYRSLFCQNIPANLFCGCIRSVRVMTLIRCRIPNIRHEIGKLIHLRSLDLSSSRILSEEDLKSICELYNLQSLWLTNCLGETLPMEIGNLICLSYNRCLKELPESIENLHELRTLNVDLCDNLSGLPEGIRRLIKLKHLYNLNAASLEKFPQGMAELTGLRTLNEIREERYPDMLGFLKKLDQLSGSLTLYITLNQGVVEYAQEAQLKRKRHIHKLRIDFYNSTSATDEENLVRMFDVLNALEPNPNLKELVIYHYGGSKFAGWISSPLNQIRRIEFRGFPHLLTLPSLGKLPFLEDLLMVEMRGLQYLGRDFLGITITANDGDTNTTVAFPKLKKLTFFLCPNWKEWEDITAEEEYSDAIILMPSLTELKINRCVGLTVLPHRLLRKAPLLKELNVGDSKQLAKCYAVPKFIRVSNLSPK